MGCHQPKSKPNRELQAQKDQNVEKDQNDE
jgi:hypothetical protein